MAFALETPRLIVFPVLLLLSAGFGVSAQCCYDWHPSHGIPGVDGSILAMTNWDPDGPGKQPELLVVGGSFTLAGNVLANNIAAWDGTSWLALGSGTGGTYSSVGAIAVFDDGSGPALYVGGIFRTAGGKNASRIARWNGTTWSSLGTGISNAQFDHVSAMTVYDDGNGSALYVGGSFYAAGGQLASNIAKWDGKLWSPLAEGLNSEVRALVVFDDGNGSALYAGGEFIPSGGKGPNLLAKWTGKSWSPLSTELGAGNLLSPYVQALTVFDDGTGPALYAGGRFATAGGVTANHIARWNGSSWSSLGTGMDNYVRALTTLDDITGPTLYIGGAFTSAGGIPADRIAKWNGIAFAPLGTELSGAVNALAVFDDGSDSCLYLGGNFTTADTLAASRIAKWNDFQYSQVGAGTGMNDAVRSFRVVDDGTVSALYAGGEFTAAGGVAANRIARWDGSEWSPLGTGIGGIQGASVRTLASFDDGTGSVLYAGGYFTTAGGIDADYIARWNGAIWLPVGQGMNGTVQTLTIVDDETGPALYAGGSFTSAGGTSANRIARWNGTTWSALGSGVSDWVHAIEVFDDGSGPLLIAGGEFHTAGGLIVNNIAQWDGATWSPF